MIINYYFALYNLATLALHNCWEYVHDIHLNWKVASFKSSQLFVLTFPEIWNAELLTHFLLTNFHVLHTVFCVLCSFLDILCSVCIASNSCQRLLLVHSRHIYYVIENLDFIKECKGAAWKLLRPSILHDAWITSNNKSKITTFQTIMIISKLDYFTHIFLFIRYFRFFGIIRIDNGYWCILVDDNHTREKNRIGLI